MVAEEGPNLDAIGVRPCGVSQTMVVRLFGPPFVSQGFGGFMRLKDKNILVTGGASGIGLATVERCLQAGARVVLTNSSLTR